MKLRDFTSEYEVTLCQSPSDGKYWAAVFKSGSKSPEIETDDYEDYEDAMACAMTFIENECSSELYAQRDRLEYPEHDANNSDDWKRVHDE